MISRQTNRGTSLRFPGGSWRNWSATFNAATNSYDIANIYTESNAGAGNDVIYAGAGNDWANGVRGNDIIFGENGNDTLYGGEGKDILMGGADNDILYGGSEDDVLVGGADNDTLIGGSGNDTYLYNAGDGMDHIYDNKCERNVLRFGAGVNKDNIKLHLGSLMLDLGGSDQIHIEGFNTQDVFNSNSISRFEFADGTVLTGGGRAAGNDFTGAWQRKEM